MGADKALVEIAGIPMIESVVSALSAVCQEVVVVGRGEGPVQGVEYLPDAGRNYRGPLGGIVTAMTELGSDLLVVAVDQPGARPSTLKHLLELAGPHPVIPEDDDWLQVTCAWYPKTLLPSLADELASGGSLRSALRSQKIRKVGEDEWRRWGESGESWRSLDSPAEVANFQATPDEG